MWTASAVFSIDESYATLMNPVLNESASVENKRKRIRLKDFNLKTTRSLTLIGKGL